MLDILVYAKIIKDYIQKGIINDAKFREYNLAEGDLYHQTTQAMLLN
jgi:hypothetical protein